MDQMPAAIFSLQNLGLDVIERDGNKNLGTFFVRDGIGFDMGPQHSGLSRINVHCANSNRNFRSGCGLLKCSLKLVRIIDAQLLSAVDDELRRVRPAYAKHALVFTLPLREGCRRVGIFPSIMIPVVHVLA